MEKKIRSEGKKLGAIAFFVSEILVILAVLAVILSIFTENSIDSGLISSILLFQGSIFAVVWGAKASSNFAKPKKDE